MESFLYACLFSNGHIKVGRSTEPASRIASHADRVSCLGVELVDQYVTIRVEDAPQREANLIALCAGFPGAQRSKSEWFSGLDFEAVKAWAIHCASADLGEFASKDWRSLFQRRDGFQKQLASHLGLAVQTVNNWQRLGIPVEFCARVEQFCEGRFTRRDFRPNDWHLIWPELA